MTMSRFAVRSIFVLALGLMGSGYALAAPVAYVHELNGKLQLQYGTRAPQSLKIGDTLDSGATLTTSAGSNAVVKFEDGQIVALQPDTQFAVRQYDFQKTNVAKSSSALELLTGGLRFVTGIIGATNRNAFKFTAGTATIGIRGTDGSVFLNRATGEVHAATNLGALAITTPLGTSNIPTGNFASATRNAAPQAAVPVAQAPQAVAQAIAQARAVAVPINTAVSVPVSARAAATQAQANVAERAVQTATTDTARQAAAAAAAEARAAATAAAQAAAQASEQATQAAVRAGAVLPAPPAPTVAPPAAPAAPATAPRPGATAPTPAAPAASTETQPASTTPATPAAAIIEALPPTAAGQPAAAQDQAITPAAVVGPTVTATPTATGSGGGGGGTASVR